MALRSVRRTCLSISFIFDVAKATLFHIIPSVS
jgi:hypothetical protein